MKSILCLSCCLGLAPLGIAQTVSTVSENDYLQDMPIVMSVSRLPQRLDETPGAVTILDRDFIRRSGARDVADLLRLVPGFQSSTSFEGDAPQASYHGAFGNYSARIQVLVDGRSVYSTYFFGSVGPGLMSVALEDIERIEVLRGSNSAAYGARAMLGVVNIVTRHTVDTQGTQVKLTSGENGVRDAQATLGWASSNASYRLSMDTRADEGLVGSNGHNLVRRLNFRSDWQVSPVDDVQLRLGTMDMDSGRGFFGNVDSPVHDRFFESNFAQMDWQHKLGSDSDVSLTLAHTKEVYRDLALYSLVPLGVNGSIALDVSGTARNDSLTLQHTFRSGSQWRVVWGGEFRREEVTSQPVYNTSVPFVTDFKRIFANAEWRIRSDLVLNAGVMAEHSTESGSSVAPRVMFNWHVLPNQTLRAGIARSYRPPSIFEKHSNLRYSFNNTLLLVRYLSRGGVQPESVLTRELGYLTDLPEIATQLDVRVFEERVSDFVQTGSYALPAGTSLLPSNPIDFFNKDEFRVHGVEYQLKWQPWKGAHIGFNQAYTNITFTRPQFDLGYPVFTPELATTLLISQKLPSGFEVSLSHQDSSAFSLQGSGSNKKPLTRTDIRLGKIFNWGSKKGELALVVQNLGLPYADFDPTFQFQRRAFVTLRLDN